MRHLTAGDAAERHFRTRFVERALELAAEGHTWKDRMPILRREFDKSEKFRNRRKDFPTQPTIQKWLKEYRSGGPEFLAPRTRNSGNRSPRCDFLFREIVLDILEQDYTTSDRETLTRVHQNAVDQYIVICEERGIEPGNCGRKVVEAIVKTIPHYDVLKWQLGSKTARQQMRTAQKFMTVEIPFDRIEIDCTEADIILADDDRNAIGRPYICSAIDCASAWIVAQRITLHRPTSEDIALVLRELMTLRVSPLVSAIRTASWRNSSVRFSPIVSLLCCNKCYQRCGIKPRQVQSVSGIGAQIVSNWLTDRHFYRGK